MTVFTRLYLSLLLVLVVTAIGIFVLVDRINHYRFNAFADRYHQALQAVVSDNQSQVALESPLDWVDLLTRLTSADWQFTDSQGAELSSTHWWSQSAWLSATQ